MHAELAGTPRPAATQPRRSHAAGLLTVSSIVTGAINYAYALVLTYRLVPEQYATFAGTQSLIAITGVIGGAGVPWVLARETAAARQSGDERRFRAAVNFGFWANVGVALLAAALMAALVLRFGSVTDAALVAAVVVTLGVGSTGMGVLQGLGHTERMAVLIAAEAVFKLAVGSVAVFAVSASAAAALVGLLAGAAVLFASLPALRGGISWPRRLHGGSSLWLSAVQIGGIQVGVGVLTALDSILAVGSRLPASDAATYQVAATFGKVPMFVSSALSAAVFPVLAARGGRGDAPRSAALHAYTAVAAFVWLALVTVPDRLLEDVLSDPFASTSRWLPYTAAAGAGWGMLNLITTFVQSHRSTGARGGWASVAGMAPLTVLGGVGMWAGAHWGGAAGLGVSTIVVAWAVTAVYCLGRVERRGLAVFLGESVRGRRPVVAVLGAAALVAASLQSVVWLAVAVVEGLAVAGYAFPELRRPVVAYWDRMRATGGGRHR